MSFPNISWYSLARRRGVVITIGQNGLVNVAAQAGRQSDQPFRMLREQILIDARLVVKAFEVARRDELDQVLVALLVLA